MSQSNMSVGNVSAPQFRSGMNDALQALASTSSGGTAPSTTYANQLWYDTTANILKMRNEANSAWINLLYIEQTGAVRVLDDTQVVNTSGTQTGLLGDQTTATWQAGTGTVESLVSPAKIKAAIDALGASSTLLGTLNTTSGSSVTLSGLDLTPYTKLEFFFIGVRSSATSFISIESSAVGVTPSGSPGAGGIIGVELLSGLGRLFGDEGSNVDSVSVTGYSTATTSVRVASLTSTFTAGSVKIYGVR